MKKISFLVIVILLSIFLLKNCEKETQENSNLNTPKKTYIDSLKNNYDGQVEALKISSEIQNPVNTYMDSRMNNRDMAKKAANVSNKRIEEQDKAMEALIK